MKLSSLVVTGILLAAQGASADILTAAPGSENCEGFNVPKSATLNIANKQVGLTTIGSGLRKKKVAIINVKVYCASAMVSESDAFKRSSVGDAALSSLDGMQDLAMRLDFVRSVDAATVKSAFEDALVANGVNTSETNIRALLDAVSNGGNAEAGKSLTFAADRKTGTVLYQDTNGKVVTVQGDDKLIHQIFSMWYGVPSDSGLAALKAQLIGE